MIGGDCCWDKLLRKAAAKGCWQWLLKKVAALKIYYCFARRRFGRSYSETTFSLFCARRMLKTMVKYIFFFCNTLLWFLHTPRTLRSMVTCKFLRSGIIYRLFFSFMHFCVYLYNKIRFFFFSKMYIALRRHKFWFCWMNYFARFGGSII